MDKNKLFQKQLLQSKIDENVKSLSTLQNLYDDLKIQSKENISLLIDNIPKRWEKFSDIVLLPNSSFRGDDWEEIISEEFWISVCNVLEVKRLARLGEIVGDKRESTVEILVGDNDWVIRKESG